MAGITEITATKRKAIMREVSTVQGTNVPMGHALLLCNRHHVRLDDVTRLLEAMGYTVVRPPPAETQITPRKEKLPTVVGVVTREHLVPPEVLPTILRGGIYKTLGNDPDADPSTVFVVTTLDKFRKEREYIHKLLQQK